MNEFEKQVLSALTDLKTEFSRMKSDIDTLRAEMNENFDEVKEDMEITRTATNYNGEKLEELTEELKKMNVIS